MKKFVAALFALSMLVSLTGCVTKTTGATPLADKGLNLINEVDKLAECEEYIALFSSSGEITNVIKSIAENDYDDPKAIFVIKDLDAIVFKNMMPEVKLPTDIESMVKGRFAGALPSQINAMNGAISLAATSILSHSGSFIYRELTDPVAYLYTYDNGYSFMVTFTPRDENIVNASVSIVINDGLSRCSTREDVVSFFVEALSFGDVSVSAVTKEK
mgnify:CR=1 FL=1